MAFIKKVPWKIWMISLVCFMIPFIMEGTLNIEGIRELGWLFHMVPVFFFTYYFGLEGGLVSSFLFTLIFALWEIGEGKVKPGYISQNWGMALAMVITLVCFTIAMGIALWMKKQKNNCRVKALL